MITNKINEKGFVSTGPIDGNITTVISGVVEIPKYASVPKWEYYLSSGSQLMSGANNYQVFRINGGILSQQNGMQLWNTSSHVFQPTVVGNIYTFNLNTRISGVYLGSTPVIHVDFEVKGNIVTGSATHLTTSMNKKSFNFDASIGPTNHSHIHTTFVIVTDDVMVASGAQFYGTVINQSPVSISSASLIIKEG